MASKNNARLITRPKTERNYERVHDAYDMCRIIAKHGDKTAFTYYDKTKKLYSISYTRFYNRIVRTAEGLTKQGLAGKKIANPAATILSACMMLDYLGESEEARRVEEVLIDVINEARIVTPDLGGTASTYEMAEYIASKL